MKAEFGADGAQRSFVEIVVDDLRQQIVSGRLQAATRLTEVSIAEEFGISRVPVREALRILEGEGFVRTKSPRVRIVAALDDAEVLDVFDVRATVETLTAARAAVRATAEQREWMHAILIEGQECLFRGELDELPGLNIRLHAAIAEAADSPMLLGLANQILPKVMWYSNAVVGQRALSSWREHAEIISAIAAGDADEARHRMREHVAGTAYAYLHRTQSANSTGQVFPIRNPKAATVSGHNRDHAVWRVRPSAAPIIRGNPVGPLRGLRTAVKDLFAIRGHAIGAGNPVFLSLADRELNTAPAVRALAIAGADIVGIAQCDEFAFSIAGVNEHYGVTPNPAAPGHLTGGSSSGPAAAVALGEADLGLGTDTAGSIRVPASYCGLWGLRISHGLGDMTGVVPLAPSFDTLGLLSRDPDILERALPVIAPDCQGDSIRRLLLVPTLMRQLPNHVLRPIRESIETLARVLGAEIDVIELDDRAAKEWYAAFRTVQHAEAWACHGAFIDAHPGAMGSDVEERFLAGRALEPTQVNAARQVVAEAAQVIRSWTPPGSALALPATSGPSPRRDTPNDEFGFTRQRTLELAFLASIAGLPALTAPLAKVGQLPQGITIAASRGHDRSLVSLGLRADIIREAS